MIRGLSVILALRGAAAAGDMPSCATPGMAYEITGTGAVPNGAYVTSSTACQQSCQAMAGCSVFTWKEDSVPAGACYLSSQLAKANADAKAISGPKECVGTNPVPAVSTEATAAVKAAAVDTTEAGKVQHDEAQAVPKFPLVAESTGVLGAAPDVGTGGKGGISNEAIYGLIGGVAGAAALAGGAYYFIGPSDKKKKKSKRAVQVDEAPMMEEARAALASAAPAATAAPAMPAGYSYGQYPAYPMEPMAQQAQMTPVPQFYYSQAPAYQPAPMYSYQYQYPGVQVATPLA